MKVSAIDKHVVNPQMCSPITLQETKSAACPFCCWLLPEMQYTKTAVSVG